MSKPVTVQVYTAVCVELDADGNVVSAFEDTEGAPWTYCKPETFDIERETWSPATEAQERAATKFLADRLKTRKDSKR